MTVCGRTKVSKGWVLGSLHTTFPVRSQSLAVTEQLQSACTLSRVYKRHAGDQTPHYL